MFDVIRAREHTRMAWRNGGGVSAEVARFPPDATLADFDWRVSIAEVAAGGPFSAYPGVERTIVLIDGAWMALTVDGSEHRLAPLVPFRFDGGASTTSQIPAPTRDLNVMARRGRVRATVEVARILPAVHLAGDDTLLLICLAGAVTVLSHTGDSAKLTPLDVARPRPPWSLALGGTGAIAVIRLAATGGDHDGRAH